MNETKAFQEQLKVLADYFWVIWLTAGLGLLIRKATLYQSFIKFIKAGAVPVSDIEILERLSSLTRKAHIGRPVELCVNPLAVSPMLTGIWWPCIVMPDMNISEKNFRYIVLHELTHYKRSDMVYKWLVQLAVCLHWFNPLVYLMSREIEKACEFSCDEAVLSKTGYGNAKDYGETLLEAMASAGKCRESFGAVTLSENKELLRERLKAIMSFRKKSKITAVLTGTLTIGIISGAFLIGVYPAAAATQTDLAVSDMGGKAIHSENNDDEKTIFSDQAQEYYEAHSIPLFSIAFSRMDDKARGEWLDKIYEEGNTSFFSVVRYLDIDSTLIQRFAEKAYADSSASFFSIAADCMSEEMLEKWLERALEDENIKFQSVLFGKLDRDEEMDAIEEELTERQRKEYESYGIVTDWKTYYYENQQVNVFLDIRANQAFYTLNIDPRGTVSIKVTRNQNDEIESVAYMTDEEVRELLTDRAEE